MKSKVIRIRLEPEFKKEVEAIAKSKGHTLSSYGRWLFEMAVKKEGRK